MSQPTDSPLFTLPDAPDRALARRVAARRELERRPVALVHDWLLGMRGGEWVLSALLKLFLNATVHPLFYDPRGVLKSINLRPVRPGPLNGLPGVRHYYRWLLPLLPGAIERVSFLEHPDLVLTTSHCVAHGVYPPPGAAHVTYYFSPMRYLYDQRAAYAAGLRGSRGGNLAAWALARATPGLARWDRAAAGRAGHIWAISDFVARRIRTAYELAEAVRPIRVIYPPVRTAVFVPPGDPAAVPPGAARRIDEYLIVSAMVPYKRVDLAIRAANRLGRRLRVVGDGPLRGELQRLAGPTVEFEGWVDEARLRELYQTRKALIFPGEEDFGIVPLEALACGMPVLGLGAGGLLETVPDGFCGMYFDKPDADTLAETWAEFHPEDYDPAMLRRQAERFSEERFIDEVALALSEILPSRA